MATRIPRRMLDKLKDARAAATLDNASFGFPSNMVQKTGAGEINEPEHIDALIRRETRIYRETWLIPRLDEVIAWAEGEDLP